jgi:hypothetical protein
VSGRVHDFVHRGGRRAASDGSDHGSPAVTAEPRALVRPYVWLKRLMIVALLGFCSMTCDFSDGELLCEEAVARLSMRTALA